ncbi:MAG TPA: hypothetical protein PKH54_03990 [Myxococcota bacterium]|nr:hypothetical protein [Myxococcota bacterium]HOA13166.1 hypothetical protein [Myxococcota bacterium]HOC99080.1 hypothetical protein [Myxococcota bacterium]HOH76307.1 hypothetical protein [Myxococcota bacterium]HPV02950.1 hypothetical protein [Myxococcota bacterium]
MDRLAEGTVPHLDLPNDNPALKGARRIARMLSAAGFEAWLAGGSVRDLLMGRTPMDFDIATSARPEQVIAIFDRTIPVGVRFGVVIVRMYGFDYEVATFRSDIGHSDGRRPDDVRFTDLHEDVKRRDFTMNGIVCDPVSGCVVDLVGGIDDIRNGVIRAIGDPAERFREDRLRQMRAIRFAAQTGFSIEPATLAAVAENAPFIVKVSAERIAEEYRKLLESGDPARGLELAARTGTLNHTIPELSADAAGSAVELARRLSGGPIELMWAAVLQSLDPQKAGDVLRRLRRSNAMIDSVVAILSDAREAEAGPSGDVAAEKRMIRRKSFADGLLLLQAVLEATGRSIDPVLAWRERAAQWKQDELFPEPLVSGNDIIAAGVARGPAIAALLDDVESQQLRNELVTRNDALNYLAGLPKIR